MKKAISLLMITLVLVCLTGCFVIMNPLIGDDNIIFEDDSKTIRLEITLRSNIYGRLYISKDKQVTSFVVDYRLTNEKIGAYIDIPDENNRDKNIFRLIVSYKNINFFRTNYDIMYLKEEGFSNPTHELLSGIDATLNRIYDQDMRPLNYFYNSWSCEENKILFINDDLAMYYKNSIKGTIQEESVWISFDDDLFLIQSDDLTIKLAGRFSFDGLNIVLEPIGSYPNFPNIITLSFVPID